MSATPNKSKNKRPGEKTEDIKNSPRDKARLLARQPHTRTNHILHPPNAAKRDPLRQLGPTLLTIRPDKRLKQTRRRNERQHSVHTDAQRPEFSSQPFRRVGDGALGRVVPDELGARALAARAADVDDGEGAVLLFGGGRGRGGKRLDSPRKRITPQIHALDVHRHDAVELVLGHVERRLVRVRRAGIVNQHIDAAVLGHRRRDGRVPIRRFGHVERVVGQVRGIAGDDGFAARRVDVAHEDVGAFGGEGARDGCPEAG